MDFPSYLDGESIPIRLGHLVMRLTLLLLRRRRRRLCRGRGSSRVRRRRGHTGRRG